MNLSEEMKKLVNKVYHGDSAAVLKLLPDESIDIASKRQCCRHKLHSTHLSISILAFERPN